MRLLAVLFVFSTLCLDGSIYETERAYLCPVESKYVPILHARLFSDPKVMSSFGLGKPYTYQKTRKRVGQHIQRWKKNYPFSGFVALSKATHKLVGYVVCGNSSLEGHTEIIYLVPSHLWEQGWGSELAEFLVDRYLPKLYEKEVCVRSGECFELYPLIGVEATVRTDNFASIKILEKLKFNFSQIVERHGAKRALYLLSLENKGKNNESCFTSLSFFDRFTHLWGFDFSLPQAS